MRKTQHVGFYVNSKNNNVSVIQDFGFLNFEKQLSESHVYISNKYPHKKTGAISVSAFVKHLNLYVFKNLSAECFYTEDMSVFGKKIYKYSSKIFYDGISVSLQSFMNGYDDMKFIYGTFKIEKTNRDGKYILLVNDRIKVHISQTDLLELMNTFHATYKGGMKKFIHDPNCHLVFGGFLKKIPYKDAFYYEYLSGTFLLVNRYGVFTESYKEVEMYNHIIDYIVTNQKNVTFFKPDFYDMSPYDNGCLTDGIIQTPAKKIFYVEVFGMHTPEYEIKKAYKQKKLEDSLISWTPLKEMLPDLSKYF